MSDKHELSFKEIISKYHPDYKNLGKSEIKLFLERSKHLKVENLVEESVAYRHIELAKRKKQKTSYNHVPNGHGKDLSDGSDVKFVSLTHSFDTKNNCYKHRVSITITSPSGEYKVGALRVVLYNNISQQLEYYFLPKKAWIKWCGNSSKNLYLNSPASGIIHKIQKYRLESFDELCMMTGEKMDEEIIKRQPNLLQLFL